MVWNRLRAQREAVMRKSDFPSKSVLALKNCEAPAVRSTNLRSLNAFPVTHRNHTGRVRPGSEVLGGQAA